MTFADLKERSRVGLHRTMASPAHYYAPDALPDAEPVVVPVRVHRKDVKLGDMQGTNLRYAEQADLDLSVIYLVEDFDSATRGGVFVISPQVAYLVDSVLPPDGVTRSATVLRARPDQFTGREAP